MSATPVPTQAKATVRRTSSDRPAPLHSPALSSSSSSNPSSPRPSYGSRSPTIGTVLSSIRTSRSRSPTVARANTTPTGSASASPTTTSGRSVTLPMLHNRSDSGNSDPNRSKCKKRNSGTVMQVGRHSDEWLFGNFSFRGTVKDLLSPSSSEHGKN